MTECSKARHSDGGLPRAESPLSGRRSLVATFLGMTEGSVVGDE